MEHQHRYHSTNLLVIAIGYLSGLIGWIYDYLEHLGVIYQLFGIDPYSTTILNGHTPQYIGGLIILIALIPPQPQRTRTLMAYGLLALIIAIRLIANLSGAFIIGLLVTIAVPVGIMLFHLQDKSLHPAIAAIATGIVIVSVGLVVDRYWHLSHPEVTGPYNMLGAPGHVLEIVGWLIGSIGAMSAVRYRVAAQQAQPAV